MTVRQGAGDVQMEEEKGRVCRNPLEDYTADRMLLQAQHAEHPLKGALIPTTPGVSL